MRLRGWGARSTGGPGGLRWRVEERRLLSAIARRSAGLALAYPGVVAVGPGDDCAVVRQAVPTGRGSGATELLLTVDQVVEGRHFVGPVLGAGAGGGGSDAGGAHIGRVGTLADLVARKAVARSISDIAAMAGRPLWALATGALPRGFEAGVAEELFEAMRRWCGAWDAPLVGGDISTTDGPLVLTVTVGGEPHPTRGPVLRSGARPGDAVYVTGRLGGTLASGRHLNFEPRVQAAAALAGALGADLTAMIDLSDGLGLDAQRVGEASGVRVEIEGARLPRAEGVTDWRATAGGGEDYELLFTVAGRRGEGEVRAAVAGAVASVGAVEVTRVGRVVEAGKGEGAAGAWVRGGEGEGWVWGGGLGFEHRG